MLKSPVHACLEGDGLGPGGAYSVARPLAIQQLPLMHLVMEFHCYSLQRLAQQLKRSSRNFHGVGWRSRRAVFHALWVSSGTQTAVAWQQ